MDRMNSILNRVLLILIGVTLFLCLPTIGQANEQWKSLAKGIEYGTLKVKHLPDAGGAIVHVVRIDPVKAKLKLFLASEHGKMSRTATQWCKEFNLVAAINAGMYHKDLITNVGYLRNRLHIQNKRWNSKYKSALAFDPKRRGISPAILIDLDDPDAMKKLSEYNAVVQNLRLVKGNGINVWAKQNKQWSEAAVGIDADGRVFFLFCRSPLAMRDFNEVIKLLGLGVIRMMHVEGGPLASLSIKSPNITLDLAGSYETIIKEDSTNKEQWPIPNVIGVQTE